MFELIQVGMVVDEKGINVVVFFEECRYAPDISDLAVYVKRKIVNNKEEV